MNDRELLEDAAKAAGLTPDVGVKIKSGHLMVTNEDVEQPFFWNPLTDDGDALRLAVKLGLVLATREGRPIGESEPDFHVDPYAATRRAIVVAAAEIGRNMKS